MTPANGEGRETDVDRMEERYDIYPIRTGTRFILCKEWRSRQIPIARFTSPPPAKVPSPTYCTRGGGEKGGGGTVEEGSANNREKSRKERVGKDDGFFGMCGRDSSLWLFRLWRDGFGRWGGRESTIAGRLFNFPPFSFDPPLLFPRRRAHRLLFWPFARSGGGNRKVNSNKELKKAS